LCHATKVNAQSGGEGLQFLHYASKVQDPPQKKIGIGPLYQKDKATRKIYREIWTLNLLPTEKIEKRFYIPSEKELQLNCSFCKLLQ
jgi:hypothetical protein